MQYDRLPFERGKTANTDLDAVSATVLSNLEGREYLVEDINPATGIQRTERPVLLRVFRNKSGFALLPKKTFGYSTTTGENYSSAAKGHGRTTAQHVAVVDEYLPAAGVADGDLFYGVIEGPSNCLTDLAGGANNVIAQGGVVVALTAATSNATTSGRVAPQDLTGATAPLAEQIQNRIGRALTARTTANTNADILIDVGKW